MDEIREMLHAVDAERIRRDLFYVANDPLPCRTLNYSLPGHEKCTLYEADDFIVGILNEGGYGIATETVPVQAFVRDPTVAWGFRKPLAHEPWYDAVNIVATKPGPSSSNEVVVIVAHKDSQSWLSCGPGAYDNAVGVVSLLEISRLLRGCDVARTIKFLFCNEEHWPWTSVDAAQRMAESDLDIVAVLNIDSIGGKSSADVEDGRLTSVTRFSTPEGDKLADLIAEVNDAYEIGLEQWKVEAERPNDDDGSFVNAGIAPAVLLIGSYPYADPNYHTLSDTPDKVDIENVRRATQLAAATVLTLCL